jgi:hypothetical protein
MMAEIEMTLPTVQYGNVKVKATPEELGIDNIGDAAAVGAATAVYLNLFSQGWKQGAAIDVVADVHFESPHEAPPGDPKVAADRLAADKKPRTVDEANEMAKRVIEQELGPTTEVDDPHAPGGSQHYDPTEGVDLADDGRDDYDAAYSAPNDGPEPAPWEAPAVDSKPKPWEAGSKKPVNVAEIEW